MTRPLRQFKSDRILQGGGVPAADIRCDYALGPLDRLARTMDRRWGIDRLPELVSIETAGRYGSAMAKLNAAIEAGDPEQVKLRAQVCMRGLKAMSDEAEAAGHPHASGDYLEYELDGFRFAILKDDREWQAAKEKRPDLEFFTLREIAVAIKERGFDHPAIEEVKKHFPAAQIIRADKKEMDDEIPF